MGDAPQRGPMNRKLFQKYVVGDSVVGVGIGYDLAFTLLVGSVVGTVVGTVLLGGGVVVVTTGGTVAVGTVTFGC